MALPWLAVIGTEYLVFSRYFAAANGPGGSGVTIVRAFATARYEKGL